MRFYLPDWDDFVDTAYDFESDIPSAVRTANREQAYIWDVFQIGDAPVDGVLVSKGQVEASPMLNVPDDAKKQADTIDKLTPDWLETLCDSGAWGYRKFPFPPHSPTEILDFYEQLGVSVGVTVDHLILGTGKSERLYLNETALPPSFTVDQMHETVRNRIDVVTAEWPETWPSAVEEYTATIAGSGAVDKLEAGMLTQPYSMLLSDIRTAPHAVYRRDDAAVREELSLANAKAAIQRYADRSYSFRLMGAIQGRDPASYAQMTSRLLDCGYQYLGIGGVAGSSEQAVSKIVRAVGNEVAAVENDQQTRIDTHLFGFAKPGGFETIGRSRISSYDSASPMRSAWVGGDNYHLHAEGDYDAIRVRYPETTASLRDAVELTLRGQELLCALRAFDTGESVTGRVSSWYDRTSTALQSLTAYLRGHKHDTRYQQDQLETIRANFNSHYPHAAALTRGFGEKFMTRLCKLLRADSATDPIDFVAYAALIETVKTVFDASVPTLSVSDNTLNTTVMDSFNITWEFVKRYAGFVQDTDLLPAYRELLIERPWQECDCVICADLGIEVVIFRGGNRNKRRGYHNTKQLYKQSEAALPSIIVLIRGSSKLLQYDTVEGFLVNERPTVWSAVHDLPIVEIGVLTADGVFEWWDSTPASVSFHAQGIRDTILTLAKRYDDIYIDTHNWSVPSEVESIINEQDCYMRSATSPHILRSGLIRRIGYEEDFLPEQPASVL